MVDFGFEHVRAGRSKRLDHVFISTYREQTHTGYGSEMWLRSVVLLDSKPSTHTGLTQSIFLTLVISPGTFEAYWKMPF